VATPEALVNAVPADGLTDVSVFVLEKVTKAFGTTAPVLSVTVAFTVSGQEVDTEFAGHPVLLTKAKAIEGEPLEPEETEENPAEAVTVAVVPSILVTLALAVTVPAPLMDPDCKVTLALPELSVKAVPNAGESVPAALSTSNVTTVFATGDPESFTTLAVSVK
jgi:hypothetical protein